MVNKIEMLATQRIDKWLWVARFFKSRTLATEAVTGGKVQCNGERCKPGKAIKPGDVVLVRKGLYQHEVKVLQLSARRLSAVKAQSLYEESATSLELREQRRTEFQQQVRIHTVSSGKPNKRDRRLLLAAKNRR